MIAIILNYRQAELTARCVASLADQIRHIWVVDNSSDDAESGKLSEYLVSMPSEILGAAVEIVNPIANLGFSRGVQYGLDQALIEGEHGAILVINNDVIAHGGMLERMTQALDAHNGRALVGPRMTKGSTPSTLWYHRLFALVLRYPLPGAFPYLSGACLLVPNSLTRPYLFDPEFFMYGEDVELSWRTAQAGLPLIIADAECDHVGSASSRIGSLFYEYHVARGHILLARKLARGRLGWVGLLLGRALSLPLRATLRSIRYKNLTPWRALMMACLRMPPHASARARGR